MSGTLSGAPDTHHLNSAAPESAGGWRLRVRGPRDLFRKRRLVEGEPQYDEFERRLAAGPSISVPTISLEGDANGAPHLEPAAYAKRFSGKYSHRTLSGGIGHNLPQEAPKVFAQAVIDVVKL